MVNYFLLCKNICMFIKLMFHKLKYTYNKLCFFIFGLNHCNVIKNLWKYKVYILYYSDQLVANLKSEAHNELQTKNNKMN